MLTPSFLIQQVVEPNTRLSDSMLGVVSSATRGHVVGFSLTMGFLCPLEFIVCFFDCTHGVFPFYFLGEIIGARKPVNDHALVLSEILLSLPAAA